MVTGLRGAALALALGLSAVGLTGCGGLDLGDNPSRDVDKQTGPLTVPPPGVVKGTAL